MGKHLIKRLTEHASRGVTTDQAKTDLFGDVPPGPSRLDPVQNLRDATLAIVFHQAELEYNERCLDDERKAHVETRAEFFTDVATLRQELERLRGDLHHQADLSVNRDAVARAKLSWLRQLVYSLAAVLGTLLLGLMVGAAVLAVMMWSSLIR